MDPAEEQSARERALEDRVQQAEQHGLGADYAFRLRDILTRRVNVFRRALRGDPPACAPMPVKLKPQAQAMKAMPHHPVKTGFGGNFFLLVRNIRAVWASPAMAVPKRDTFRLVCNYQAINSQVEQSPGVMPNHEDMSEVLGARFFGMLDLLQGYWQIRLALEP